MAQLRLQANWQRKNFRLNIDTTLPAQGITALFGRSGCGKSSLLRLIAGLDTIPAATVVFNNQQWQTGRSFIPLHQRRIGLVFQQASLLPHLSAGQNLRYGFERVPAAERRLQPDQVIRMLELQTILTQPVNSLSGGQQQRLALGRALLANPQLLLLDEPFAALDSQSKTAILPYIRTLVSETKVPIIFVSHDSREVEKLADHLVLMDGGQIRQQSDIKTALADPQSPLFDGSDITSLFFGKAGKVDQWGRHPVFSDGCCIWLGAGTEFRSNDVMDNTNTGEVRLCIRAKDVSLALRELPDISIQNQLPAQIIKLQPYLQQILVTLKLADGQLLQAEITPCAAAQLQLQPGMPVVALIKAIVIR